MAVTAPDFAGKLVLDGFLGRVVPLEVVVTVCEVDVGFVEDGGPLEGGGCVVVNMYEWRRVGVEKSLPYRAVSGTSCSGIACCRGVPACSTGT